MKKSNVLGNRLIALALCVIMVLSMAPKNVVTAAGSTSVYGTVTSLSDGVTITGNGAQVIASYEGTLKWCEADPTVGRYSDGWWVGIKVTAPAGMTAEQLQKATYLSGSAEKYFWVNKDSADGASEHYITLWGLLTEEYLKQGNLAAGLVNYTWKFNWDGSEGDEKYEQTVILSVDATKTVLLKQDNTQAYPAADLGYGSLQMLTAGATISNNDSASITASYDSPTTVDWVAADPSIGRYQDGWWAGMKITVPAGMTEEQVKNAQFMSGTDRKSFWTYKDSHEGDASHFMTMWVPLNTLLSAGELAPYVFKFDWNNDGIYEQTVTTKVDPAKITLKKDGAQVFPVLGQVSVYTGGTVSGSGTSNVIVMVDETTLNWSEANPSIGRYQDAWWVGIKVEAPAGMDSAALQNAKYQTKNGPSVNWSADKSFWSNRDSDSHIGMWVPIKPATLQAFKNAGQNITMWYRFDWDNDGTFEQNITFSVNPNGNIVLNKKDQTDFHFATLNPEDIWVGNTTYQNIASGGQGDGAITYEIIEGDAATIDAATGVLTFTEAGTVTVKATKAADSEGYYNAVTAEYTITAVKNDQAPKFSTSQPGAITYAPGATFENAITDILGGTVKYEIIDETVNGTGVATIDEATGKLTILKAGTVTVKATITGDVQYNPAEVTYTLVIEKANQPDFAFDNPISELTWQPTAIDALKVVNGLGEGTVIWTITSGTDVASVDAAGKITLLKAGSFTIQAQKASDDCYNASAEITTTILVNKAEQSAFGFGETEKVTVTYNDNGNQYTLAATGGQSSKDVVYTVISGDAATVDNDGVVTIVKAGTVTIQATRPADDRYEAISDTYELTINSDTQEFAFEDGEAVDIFYGTTEYTNKVVFSGEYGENSSLTYTISDNEIGAAIDAATGKITFTDSETKIGTVTVTATKAADDCYSEYSTSYTLNVSYLTTDEKPVASGDKRNESVWFTGNVVINAPEGFTISTDNELSTADWSDKVKFSEEGANKTATVYLKNADGYITDAISVGGIYTDTGDPEELKISYTQPTWEVVLESISFGLYQSETLQVTISAKDENSGIASLAYNIGNGDVTVPVDGTASASHSFTINAQHRNEIVLTVTDVSGRQTKLKDETVVVLDTKNPEITAEYEYASGRHREDNGIYYTQEDATITFTIDEANFDLSGLEIKGANGEKTGVPVVKVNGTEKTVTWAKVEGTTTWEGKLTLHGNGDYVVSVTFTDAANNTMEPYEQEIRIDATQPVISVAYDNNEAKNGNYYNADRTPTVQISAHNFKPEGVKLTVSAKDITGADVDISSKAYADYAKNPANWSNKDDVWTLDTTGMKFDIDAIYSVKIECVDLNENAADAYVAEFVIDKTDADNIKIEYSTSVVDKVLEAVTFGFYKADVTVTVTAEDMTAGVAYFEIAYTQVNGANNSNKASYKTEQIAAVQDAANKNVFTATHTITAEARGKVSVDVMDKAGNDSSKADDKILVVDTVAPGLDVKYIFTDDQKREYNNIFYTKGETRVQFTIDEANFDLTQKTADDESANKTPIATVNNIVQEVSWTQIDGTNKWVGEVTLAGNGDYIVGLTFADRSGNEMQTFSKEIHIDNVAPAFEVTYDNNEARNTNKFKADRTATIQITEHNFNASEVKLTVAAKDITGADVNIASKAYADYAKDPANWSHVGDVWTLKTDGMKFDTDAIYSIKLEYMDLAENAADIYTADFVIDKTAADNIKIAYSTPVLDKLLESLTFGFYQAEVEVTITAEDMTAGVEYFEITYTRQDGASATNKETFTTDPLAATQDSGKKNVFTATYKIPAQARGTVSAVVMDQAGNDSSGNNPAILVVDDVAPTREVIYTPYKILDEATMLEVDEYKEGDNSILYYKDKAVVTFKITEANFDLSLMDDAAKPVIKVNNAPVTVEWTQEGDVWTATYTIAGDGDYVVTMAYKDLSTNKMVDYESCKIAIDGSAPVIDVKYTDGVPAQTVAGTKYYKTAQTIAIQITDHNFRADDVVLTVTAKNVQGKPVDISAKAYADYAKNGANWTTNGDVHTLNTAGMVFDIDAIYTFDIAYDDICDNFASDYAQDNFVVDHTAPTGLKITYSTPVIEKVIESLTFGFYQPSVTVTLTVDDATAGVDSFDWTFTKQADTSAKNAADNGGKITTSDITYTNGGKTATATFTIPANARGYVSATVSDRAGNNAEKIDNTVINVVDNIAPSISVTYKADSSDTKVQFVDAAKATVDSFSKATNAFYNGNVTATIVIKEANFFEGVAATDGVIHQVGIKLTKTDDNGNKTVVEYLPVGATQKYADAKAEYITWTTEGDVHSLAIPYADNADYVLEITYTDLSTNDAGISANDGLTATKSYTSKVVTVDKVAPVITVEYGNTEVINTIGDRKYFDKTQSAVITVTEHNFRAAEMKAAVTAVDFLNSNVAVADFAAQLADEKNWTHNGNVHTAKIAYTVDANYTFDIDFVDLAQNASADYKTDLFTVDTTAPTNLTVSYSTNVFEEILESITFGYYNATMTVTITANDATTGVHHFTYSYINGKNVSGVNAELLNQAIQSAEIRNKNGTATATFDIPKMVLGNNNQFNGTVEFTAYDRSENSRQLRDSTRIVVDNISPTATINYNNPVQSNNGISYYDGNVEASIVINEANFDSGDVVVTVTKDGANYPVNVLWQDNSADTHIGSFVLTENGDYIVSVQYTDKSGNQMAAYTSNKLTLDATAPTIKVSNIKNNSANKDAKYGFVIEVNDINLDASSIKPVLKAVKQTAEGVYQVVEIDLGKAATAVNGQTYTYTVENLPDDGLYTLTCEVQDMSANGMSQIVLEDGRAYDQVQFSINRSGSTFGYGNTFTEELAGQYYTYSVDEDVVIAEVNVDPIEEYKVSLNGKELVEGTDYTTVQTSKNGEWSKRTYTIKKALFEAEGEYSIIVTSTDKADTTVFSDVKNLSMAFVVDQTKPVLTITGLEAGGRYQTDAQTVTLIPTDEGGRLNSLSVEVLDSNGNPLKDGNGTDISARFEMSGEELLKYLTENDGKVTFTIPEGLNNKVRIICNDCATNADNLTNEYNELFERVTVSQNPFVIFYANTSLFIGTIVGVLAIIALCIFLIKRKSDKKTKATAKS